MEIVHLFCNFDLPFNFNNCYKTIKISPTKRNIGQTTQYLIISTFRKPEDTVVTLHAILAIVYNQLKMYIPD